jgi:hypothetical protein
VRTAYKFLAPGAVSPFTGFRWPEAGRWVSAPDQREESGIFACRDRDLPYWLERELWVMELEEPVREGRHQLSAPRARLVGWLARWDGDMLRAYAWACALRARELALPALQLELRRRVQRAGGPGEVAEAVASSSAPSTVARYLGDAASLGASGEGAAASYVASVLAATLAGDPSGFEAERAWQARWLGEHVGLAPG